MWEKIDDYGYHPPRKAPKGAGELILYLDYDGVLHHENCLWHPRKGPYLKAPSGHVLFQHAPLLAEVLEPYPDWKIVLSTSWVRTYGFYGAGKRLPEALRGRLIGATFHSRMNRHEFVASPRGMQVWGDVVIRQPRHWIALDDDYLHWPKWALDNYVQTDAALGISKPDVLGRLKRLLELHQTGSGD